VARKRAEHVAALVIRQDSGKWRVLTKVSGVRRLRCQHTHDEIRSSVQGLLPFIQPTNRRSPGVDRSESF